MSPTTITSKLVAAVALLSPLLLQPTEASWPKRGLAANDDIPIWQFSGSWNNNPSQVNWQYNWDSTTTQKQSWAEYVPMLWGTQSYHTNQWSSNANYWLSQGSGHLLAFNEPDRSDQANLSPGDAANAYRQYMQPFKGHAQLGAPAISNAGLSWLQSFMSTCSDCQIDFVPVHWYNDHSLFSDLQSYINQVCQIANGRQVWLTEFMAYGTIDQQSAFLKQAIPWLDNNSCVYRYAWFGVADPSQTLLQNGGPSLSAMGVQYAFTPYGQASM